MKPRYQVSINLTLETNEPIKDIMQELCSMIKIARVDGAVVSATPGSKKKKVRTYYPTSKHHERLDKGLRGES